VVEKVEGRPKVSQPLNSIPCIWDTKEKKRKRDRGAILKRGGNVVPKSTVPSGETKRKEKDKKWAKD